MRDKFNKKDKYGRDIILEYASFGSNVYAPLTRDGRNPDRKSFKLEMQSDYLTTYEGIYIYIKLKVLTISKLKYLIHILILKWI